MKLEWKGSGSRQSVRIKDDAGDVVALLAISETRNGSWRQSLWLGREFPINLPPASSAPAARAAAVDALRAFAARLSDAVKEIEQ